MIKMFVKTVVLSALLVTLVLGGPAPQSASDFQNSPNNLNPLNNRGLSDAIPDLNRVANGVRESVGNLVDNNGLNREKSFIEHLPELFSKAFTTFASAITDGLKVISFPFRAIMDMGKSIINPMTEQTANIIDGVTGGRGGNLLRGTVKTSMDTLDNAVKSGTNFMGSVAHGDLSSAAGTLGEFAQDGMNRIGSTVEKVGNLASETGIPQLQMMGSLAEGSGKAVTSLSHGDYQGAANSMFSAGKETVTSPLKNGINAANSLANTFGLPSPSNVFSSMTDNVSKFAGLGTNAASAGINQAQTTLEESEAAASNFLKSREAQQFLRSPQVTAFMSNPNVKTYLESQQGQDLLSTSQGQKQFFDYLKKTVNPSVNQQK